MTWTSEGLRLGAGTRLARSVRGEEARILALLSVAADRACPTEVLESIKRAEVEFRSGNLAKSAMYLALAYPQFLIRLDDAYRLYAATALIDQGLLTPLDLMRACEIDRAHVEVFSKYSPDQPRAPAGALGAGQWIREGDAGLPTAERKARPKPIQSAILLPEGCDKEWTEAIKICIDLLDMPDPPRGQTGGHTTVHGCAKGFVSERRRGNPVEY